MMDTNAKKKMSLITKILIAVGALILVLIVSILLIFFNELKTINSLTKIDDYPMYTLQYEGDYYFDEYLEVGASSDEEVLEFIIDKLLKGISIEIELPDLGCATMNAITPEGDHVFGRNFDLELSPPSIVHTAPKNGYKSVTTVNLSFMGYSEDFLPDDSFMSSVIMLAAPYVPIDGMNEKGLAVGILLIRNMEPTAQDTTKIDLQTTTAVRMLLDKCATVDEAIDMLEEYDMYSSAGSNYHLQIADATGNSAVVEYIDSVMTVIYPEEFYQACTNFILTPGEFFEYGDGHDRYEIIMNKLTETNGVLTEDEMMDLLEAAKLLASEEDGSNTQWSVVYNQNDLSGIISVGMDYENIHSFTLEKTIIE